MSTTATTAPEARPGTGAHAEPAAAPAEPDPPRQQARRGVLAAGIALVAVAITAGAWFGTQAGGEATSVLVLTGDLEAGQPLTRDVLRAAEVTAGEDLGTIAVSDVDTFTGLLATGNLPAGTILTPSMFTDQVVASPGQAIVGVALTPAQLPATGVRPGDRISLVMGVSGSLAGPPASTGSGDDADPAAPATTSLTTPGRAWSGTVIKVGATPASDGSIVVDIALTEPAAGTLAAAAASRNLMVVLHPPEQGPGEAEEALGDS